MLTTWAVPLWIHMIAKEAKACRYSMRFIRNNLKLEVKDRNTW